MLEKFSVSWLDKLRTEDPTVRDSGAMGWRYEDGKRIGFMYGNTLYYESGQAVPLVTAADDEFNKWYAAVGKREVWLKAAKLLTDRKRPELDILIAMAFAAPLTVFSGAFYGAVLSVWGAPGTSKSTAQQVSAAVWGHPKQTRESLNSTVKSVQGRLGRTRNLPAYWDDVQDRRHQENLFQTLFVTSEGAEGGRLNSDASMKTRLEWQTLLVVCSNASFVEFMIRKHKFPTAAIRRVFEFKFSKDPDEPGIIDAVNASKIFGELQHNYGVIGAEYAQLLARNHNKIDTLVASITRKFKAAVDGTGDESYWWGLCGVLLTGAALARQLGVGLNVDAMENFLQEAYQFNRRIRNSAGLKGIKGTGSYADTERELTGFLQSVGSGHVMFTNGRFEHRYRNRPVKVLHPPEQGCRVLVQVVRDQCLVILAKAALQDYLHSKGVRPLQFFKGLEHFFNASETRKTLGSSTKHAQIQEFVLEIPVPLRPDHVLYELLCRHGMPVRQPGTPETLADVHARRDALRARENIRRRAYYHRLKLERSHQP
jgi:hypothetical protein